jgi:RsiW-degrading membrane proteinase PrsW (M82 family)
MVAAIVLACISIVLALSVAVGFAMMSNSMKGYSGVQKSDPSEQAPASTGVQMISPSADNA